MFSENIKNTSKKDDACVIFDNTALQIRIETTDKAQLLRLYLKFLDSLPALKNVLIKNVHQLDNRDELLNCAHKTSSTAAMIGAMQLFEKLKALEVNLKHHNTEESVAIVNKSITALDLTSLAIKRWTEKLTTDIGTT
jgi:HPt (histidine-containing phosphotransfer) domain-containing protein